MSDKNILIHHLAYCGRNFSKILEFVDEFPTIEEAIKDEKTQDAVCMRLIQVGERASRAYRKSSAEDLKEIGISNEELSEIIGMRNRIVHEYEKIDLDIIVDTVKYDVPRLLDTIQKIVDQRYIERPELLLDEGILKEGPKVSEAKEVTFKTPYEPSLDK